jgi:hypothetical protein
VPSQTGTAPGRVGPLRPGDPRRVGGYKLTGLLGEGGMGQVFLGRSQSGCPVAVKLIRPEYARQPAFRERFAREVAAARMVGGFHAVPVVDADPRAERPWMATAYIAAPSLQDRVDTGGPARARHHGRGPRPGGRAGSAGTADRSVPGQGSRRAARPGRHPRPLRRPRPSARPCPVRPCPARRSAAGRAVAPRAGAAPGAAGWGSGRRQDGPLRAGSACSVVSLMPEPTGAAR